MSEAQFSSRPAAGRLAAISLPTYLMRMVWLCLLPLLIVAIGFAIYNVQSTQVKQRLDAEALARSLAADTDQFLIARISALRVVALSPLAADPRRRHELYLEARAFRESFGNDVLLVSDDLQMLFNTHAPYGTKLPRVPRPKGTGAAPLAFQTGKPAIGDLLVGPVIKELLVAIAVPILRDGKPHAVLLTTLPVRLFQRRLDELRVPPEWSLTLFDGNHDPIARHASANQVASNDINADGRIVVKSAVSNWSVELDIPRSSYFQPLLITGLALAIAIFAAALLGAVGGIVGSRRLAKSVAQMSDPAAAEGKTPAIQEFVTLRLLLSEVNQNKVSNDAARREGEQKFRNAFANASIGFAMTTADGNFVEANSAYCTLVGYTVDELKAIKFWQIVHPEDRTENNQWIERLRAGEMDDCVIENRYVRKDGGEVTVRKSLSVVRHPALGAQWIIVLAEDITARKQAELRRHHFSEALRQSSQPLLLADRETRITYINPAFSRLFGFEQDELAGKLVATLVPLIDGAKSVHDAITREVVLHGSSSREVLRMSRDGIQIAVLANVGAMHDEKGDLAGFVASYVDLRPLQAKEATLRQLALAVEQSPESILITNLAAEIEYVNEAFLKRTGYRREEVIGHNPRMLQSGATPPDTYRMMWATLRRGDSWHGELHNRGKNGAMYVEHSVISPLKLGTTITHYVAVQQDITARKRQAALDALLAALARTTNEASTPEAGLQACLDRICAFGAWAIGHFGLFAAGQTTGIAPVSIWRCADRERFSEFMRETDLLHRGSPTGHFFSLAVRERRPVWIENAEGIKGIGRLTKTERFGIRAALVLPVFVGSDVAGFLEFFACEPRAPDHEFLGAIEAVTSQLARLIERSRSADVLIRVNAELELRVARRTVELEAANKELNSFSYTIAHDLRAPVRAIGGYSSLVLENSRGKLDVTAIGYLERVRDGSERMAQMIDDLLNMARRSRQEMQRVDLNLSDMAASVVEALKHSDPGRNVMVTIQPDIGINADAGLLRDVLENLIGNSWKYTGKRDAAHIEIGARPHDGRTAYFIRDNGAGFDMKYAHKLFAPFQRLHQRDEFEGTGIGLATVRRIIERHGGTIWIESAVDQGTAVFFTIGESV